MPNENLVNTPRINTISLPSEENFVSPTDINVDSTAWEQAECASSPEIATIDFETEMPENIVIEESQMVFEEPCVSYKEIQTEIEENRTVTDGKEVNTSPNNLKPKCNQFSQKETP